MNTTLGSHLSIMHPSMSLELVVGGRVILGFITDLLGNKLIVQSNYDLSGGLKREITTLYSYLFIHCVQLSGQWLILVPVVQNTMWVTIEPTCKGSVSVRCWSSTDFCKTSELPDPDASVRPSDVIVLQSAPREEARPELRHMAVMLCPGVIHHEPK